MSESVEVEELTFELLDFPTHIPQTNKDWIKVNMNKIYGAVNFHVREKLVSALKAYLIPQVPKGKFLSKFPVKVTIELHVPINYGSVRRRKTDGTILWRKPSHDYIPNWDFDNVINAWYKTIQDVIKLNGIIPEDTVIYVDEKHEKFIPCETLDERKIVVKLQPVKIPKEVEI